MRKENNGKILRFLSGKTLPGEVDPSWRARHPKILASYRFTEPAEGRALLLSNHPRRVVFEWLVSKILSGDLISDIERKLILFLSAEKELWFKVLIFLIEETDQKLFLPAETLRKMTPQSVLEEAYRRYRGTKISVTAVGEWSKQYVSTPNRIGVGYKDKGSLGSGLSWKDQILTEEDFHTEENLFLSRVFLLSGDTPNRE